MVEKRDPDYFPIFLLGILLGAILTIGSLVSVHIAPEKLQGIKMGYSDFVTILLTAVTVIITMLAVFIGILALWGYSQFEKMTESASQNHLTNLLAGGPFAKKIEDVIVQHITKQLQDGELRKVLVERIDQIILSDAAQRAERTDTVNGDERFED